MTEFSTDENEIKTITLKVTEQEFRTSTQPQAHINKRIC